MAYTPELSTKHSQMLRRLAWSMDVPMTKAMHEIFNWLPQKMDREKICSKCRDKSRCKTCVFNE